MRTVKFAKKALILKSTITLGPCHLQLLLGLHRYYYCPLGQLLVIPFPTNCTYSQSHSLPANFSTNCIRCQSTSPAATCLHCPPVSPFLTVPLRSGVTWPNLTRKHTWLIIIASLLQNWQRILSLLLGGLYSPIEWNWEWTNTTLFAAPSRRDGPKFPMAWIVGSSKVNTNTTIPGSDPSSISVLRKYAPQVI